MVRGTVVSQPTRVQVLVLAFVPEFISGFPAMHIQWEKTFPSTTRFYFRISGDAHSVGGDVPVDDEVPTATS